MTGLHFSIEHSVLAAVLLCACTDADAPSDTHLQELAGTGCAPLSVCAITETRCQQAVLTAAACERGEATPALPPIRFIVRDQLREVLQQDEGAAMPGMQQTAAGDAALRAFHLLQPQMSADDASLEQRAHLVSAFYHFERKDVTIVSDADVEPRDALVTLAHELTHYLQDRAGQLELVRAQDGATLDERVARLALVEGEARLMELHLAARIARAAPKDLRWNALYAELDKQLAQATRSSTSPIITAYTLIPYVVSLPELEWTWEHEGQAGIAALYESPASSTLFWFNPDDTHDQEPLACQPPLAPDGYELEALDRFGVTGLYALLATQVEPRLRDVRDWRNDALAVYRRRDASEPSVLAVWRLRFGDASAAERFEQRLEPLHLAMTRDDVEVTISVSSDPDQPALAGAALAACPPLDALQASLPQD